MPRFSLSFLAICLLIFTNVGYSQVEEIVKEADKKSHLLLPAPPLDYNITRTPLVVEGKFIGFLTILQKEGSIGKVTAQVDLRADADFSQRGFRSGGIKGYLNGLVENIQTNGYKPKSRKLPDINKSDLKDWIQVDMEFEKPDGKKLLIQKRVFFDTRGFDITVIAETEAELATLSEWASKIELTKETK